jgi:serine/threonine protein kinase
MAPEQITSETVDHRADLWSVGVIGYEAVTGKAPFTAASRSATASRVFTHEPPPARTLRPEVPRGLSELLSALLAKSPDARVQTAAEASRRLAALLASSG